MVPFEEARAEDLHEVRVGGDVQSQVAVQHLAKATEAQEMAGVLELLVLLRRTGTREPAVVALEVPHRWSRKVGGISEVVPRHWQLPHQGVPDDTLVVLKISEIRMPLSGDRESILRSICGRGGAMRVYQLPKARGAEVDRVHEPQVSEIHGEVGLAGLLQNGNLTMQQEFVDSGDLRRLSGERHSPSQLLGLEGSDFPIVAVRGRLEGLVPNLCQSSDHEVEVVTTTIVKTNGDILVASRRLVAILAQRSQVGASAVVMMCNFLNGAVVMMCNFPNGTKAPPTLAARLSSLMLLQMLSRPDQVLALVLAPVEVVLCQLREGRKELEDHGTLVISFSRMLQPQPVLLRRLVAAHADGGIGCSCHPCLCSLNGCKLRSLLAEDLEIGVDQDRAQLARGFRAVVHTRIRILLGHADRGRPTLEIHPTRRRLEMSFHPSFGLEVASANRARVDDVAASPPGFDSLLTDEGVEVVDEGEMATVQQKDHRPG